MGRAVQALVVSALEPVNEIAVAPAGRAADVAGSPSLFCRYSKWQGRLILECWREGDGQPFYRSGGENDVASLAGAAAQTIHPRAQVANVRFEALRAFGQGNPEDALRLDPTFAPAWLDAVERRSREDVAAARSLAADGIRSVVSPVAKARLELVLASLDGNRAKQADALSRLLTLTAPDVTKLEALAGIQIEARRLPDAIGTLARVTALAPQNATAWNQLGYAKAAAGDLAGAKAALEKYRELSPGTPNPIDSLGEIHYLFGEFSAAEKYFLEAVSLQPGFNSGQALYKAAWAKAMQNDRPGADALFEKFVGIHAESDRAWLREQWASSFGASEAIIAALRATSRPDLNRIAPNRRLGLAMSAFVVQPSAPAEIWRARAEQALPGPQFAPVREFLIVLALLIDGRHADAEPLATELLSRTSPLNDGRPRIFAAWAADGLGKTEEARRLLRLRTIPLIGPSDTLGALFAARERELRAKLGL